MLFTSIAKDPPLYYEHYKNAYLFCSVGNVETISGFTLF